MDIEKSIAICEAASKGPWECVRKLSGSENHKGFFVRCNRVFGGGKWALAEVHPGDEDGGIGEANAAFIADARENFPEALRRLKRIAELHKKIYYCNTLQTDPMCIAIRASLTEAEHDELHQLLSLDGKDGA